MSNLPPTANLIERIAILEHRIADVEERIACCHCNDPLTFSVAAHARAERLDHPADDQSTLDRGIGLSSRTMRPGLTKTAAFIRLIKRFLQWMQTGRRSAPLFLCVAA